MNTKKKNQLIYKIPALFLVAAIVVVGYKFIQISLNKVQNSEPTQITAKETLQKDNNPNSAPSDWKEYNNTEARFVMKIPPLLLKRRFENPSDYQTFIKFEENKYSNHKGVALGITNRSVEEEVKKVMEEIGKDVAEKPVDSNIKIDGQEARRLDYKEKGFFEARSAIIVNGNDITLSISTTPEQIVNIINSVNFY